MYFQFFHLPGYCIWTAHKHNRPMRQLTFIQMVLKQQQWPLWAKPSFCSFETFFFKVTRTEENSYRAQKEYISLMLMNSFSFSSRWHHSTWKGPCALCPTSQQSPQGCLWNSANICLVEYRWFPTSKRGLLAASFLNSSFLQASNNVMLWLVHVQKVPQASEHLCPAKLQTRCDICCAC